MSTIRDVAKLAGVSTATVSRVLNNDTTYKMTDETRNKVWAAVAQLNYKPNLVARMLSTNTTAAPTTHRIGCVLSVIKDKYKDPYFMSILSGIERRLQKHRLQLSFVRTYFELEDQSVLYGTFSEPVTGMILMESLNSSTYDYIRARVPHIVGIDTQRRDIDSVGYDHYEIAAEAVRHLIAKGHRDIAFIGSGGLTGDIKTSLRYQGFYATMHAAGLSVNPAWVKDCQWDEALCMRQATEIGSMNPRPTAIFAASDLMAIAALSALYSLQIAVPSQMAVIGLSNIELSQFSSPPLTTLDVPTQEIGMVAADMLLSRIDGDTMLPKKVILPFRLIQRAST